MVDFNSDDLEYILLTTSSLDLGSKHMILENAKKIEEKVSDNPYI